MADQVTVTNLPDSGSPARVALDMMRYLQAYLPEKDGKVGLQGYFDLYEQCHRLARGHAGDASKIFKS